MNFRLKYWLNLLEFIEIVYFDPGSHKYPDRFSRFG